MQTQDIYIRDPYILPWGGIYYMYGKTLLNEMSFCVYTSKDLKEWSEPNTVFEKTEDFWADRDFWAPEVHEYKGRFYMFASFKSETHHRATQILVSDKPDGQFEPLTDAPITPKDWECLDGTLYIDKKGKPHIVFCHEWTQIGDGTICSMELSDDLKTAAGEPKLLWKASDYSGTVDMNEETSKITDGPFLYRMEDGELICIWSTFTKNGYSEIVSRSDNGDIDGNWISDEIPLSARNGGHGMIFKTFEGETFFVMHCPNDSPLERAVMYRLKENGTKIKLGERI